MRAMENTPRDTRRNGERVDAGSRPNTPTPGLPHPALPASLWTPEELAAVLIAAGTGELEPDPSDLPF